MDHSTVDYGMASNATEETASALGPVPASVSAGIAAANAFVSVSSETARFPGEDGGYSLAEMAQSDLDAALQLLADRAQYITGASGAAIALRHADQEDMLCRASAGCNAPELGARVSMEYGLSGESARTGKALRCDDAEKDPRVNREGCRQLGISSVVVMPIVSEGQVLGVFELFSGKVSAFDDRDLAALQRLSEMVEMAVRHAIAAQSAPVAEALPVAEEAANAGTVEEMPSATVLTPPETAPSPEPSRELSSSIETDESGSSEPREEKPNSSSSQKRPLFWSANLGASNSVPAGPLEEASQSIAVPPVLRSLQKCQACGFPVSQGRTYCVECEEKKWRGQPLAQKPTTVDDSRALLEVADPLHAETVDAERSPMLNAVTQTTPLSPSTSSGVDHSVASSSTLHRESEENTNAPPFLASTAPAESWLASNKYILSTLLLLVIIALVAWLR